MYTNAKGVKSIKFKTVGYICLDVTTKKTKAGKIFRTVKVLSKKVYKHKKTMLKAKTNIKGQFVVNQSLSIISHALNVEKLRNDYFYQKAQIAKLINKNRFVKFWSKSVAYARTHSKKIILYKYINSLNRATKEYLNDFLKLSDVFNFSLSSLNLR